MSIELGFMDGSPEPPKIDLVIDLVSPPIGHATESSSEDAIHQPLDPHSISLYYFSVVPTANLLLLFPTFLVIVVLLAFRCINIWLALVEDIYMEVDMHWPFRTHKNVSLSSLCFSYSFYPFGVMMCAFYLITLVFVGSKETNIFDFICISFHQCWRCYSLSSPSTFVLKKFWW